MRKTPAYVLSGWPLPMHPVQVQALVCLRPPALLVLPLMMCLMPQPQALRHLQSAAGAAMLQRQSLWPATLAARLRSPVFAAAAIQTRPSREPARALGTAMQLKVAGESVRQEMGVVLQSQDTRAGPPASARSSLQMRVY